MKIQRYPRPVLTSAACQSKMATAAQPSFGSSATQKDGKGQFSTSYGYMHKKWTYQYACNKFRLPRAMGSEFIRKQHDSAIIQGRTNASSLSRIGRTSAMSAPSFVVFCGPQNHSWHRLCRRFCKTATTAMALCSLDGSKPTYTQHAPLSKGYCKGQHRVLSTS